MFCAFTAPVDVNSLKATITSYESLHETKKSNSDFDEAPSKLTKDLEKGRKWVYSFQYLVISFGIF